MVLIQLNIDKSRWLLKDMLEIIRDEINYKMQCSYVVNSADDVPVYNECDMYDFEGVDMLDIDQDPYECEVETRLIELLCRKIRFIDIDELFRSELISEFRNFLLKIKEVMNDTRLRNYKFIYECRDLIGRCKRVRKGKEVQPNFKSKRYIRSALGRSTSDRLT
tara:strand:- start:172928 stop:173419 length:492 start_codon:yes stop_codon:yes gene_type:complete